MTLAYAQTDSYVIHYRLTKKLGGIKLKLWELTTLENQNRVDHPHLYIANLSFQHIHEAEAFLRNHLLVNGAIDVPETNFPEEGQAAILPFPTWGIDK